jgi:transcriptional regulator with XRE-family HTH domain
MDTTVGEKKPDMVTKAFAKRLKKLRLARDFKTAAEFADHLGVEPPTYRTYERGTAEPNFSTLLRICQQLETTPNDLLLGRWNMKR